MLTEQKILKLSLIPRRHYLHQDILNLPEEMIPNLPPVLYNRDLHIHPTFVLN
jgi:hypothetical protein